MDSNPKEILESFRSLEKNWNGYDADPIPNKSIDKALELLDYLKGFSEPEVFPTARDSVQFEWGGKDREYLEFEIFEDRIESLMIVKLDEFGRGTEYDFIIPNNLVALEYLKYFQSNFC
jgi:hypothetical protein